MFAVHVQLLVCTFYPCRTISERNGQTLQGVRYTAVADDSTVDPNLIYETLVKYFGFS